MLHNNFNFNIIIININFVYYTQYMAQFKNIIVLALKVNAALKQKWYYLNYRIVLLVVEKKL